MTASAKGMVINMKKVLVTFVVLAALLIAAGFGSQYLTDRFDDSTETASNNTKSSNADTSKDAAPDFTVTDADGNDIKLSSLFGKPIIINFWAEWCGPCVNELPLFQSAYEKYGDDIHFVMVNQSGGVSAEISDITAFVDENSYTFPVYFDVYQEGSGAYYSQYIPHTHIIDKDGKLIDEHVGQLDEDGLQAFISELGY